MEDLKKVTCGPYAQGLRYTRVSDHKVFHVVFYSHWTDIRSDDGETDTVKWMGDETFVSADKGHSYVRTRVDG